MILPSKAKKRKRKTSHLECLEVTELGKKDKEETRQTARGRNRTPRDRVSNMVSITSKKTSRSDQNVTTVLPMLANCGKSVKKKKKKKTIRHELPTSVAGAHSSPPTRRKRKCLARWFYSSSPSLSPLLRCPLTLRQPQQAHISFVLGLVKVGGKRGWDGFFLVIVMLALIV